jgi:Xaa-Pro dipeptidase
VILAPGPNLRYYTGVSSFLLERPFLFMVPAEGDPHLVAPTLESGPYTRTPVKITLHSWSDTEGSSGALQEIASQLQLNGRWGLEGSVPYRYVHRLLQFVQPQFDNADPILQAIRAVKDQGEVKLLTRAASILSKSFLQVFHMMKPGVKELAVAQKLSREVVSNGADSVEDVLVQSGPMAADSHHLSSSRKLRRKESIVVDATCTFRGYYADVTRTFIIGRDMAFEELYERLLEAQIAAVKASRVGVTVGSVDYAARDCLRKHQLDRYFVHRTGHGLGLEVHEAPYIIPNGTEITRPSMAFTIEPGAYIQGKTGIRIEDDLITTSVGNRVLTRSVPKDYGWWD